MNISVDVYFLPSVEKCKKKPTINHHKYDASNATLNITNIGWFAVTCAQITIKTILTHLIKKRALPKTQYTVTVTKEYEVTL